MTMPGLSLEERFWLHVRKTDTCWFWNTPSAARQYGSIQRNGRMVQAHRVAYELLVGPIPAGLQIDHLCRNRACVNPEHLEPVTRRENLIRGAGFAGREARATHCPQGHPYSGDNLIIGKAGRQCRVCKNASMRRWWHRTGKQQRDAKGRPSRAHG